MTTYYIHPDTGRDENDGQSESAPWRSFAPLQSIDLAPGDRVNVLSRGSFDTSLHIRGVGTADEPIVIRLAPGRYDMHPQRLTRRRYHVSNCNADPEGDKAIALLFDHARHVRVEGEGARIVCRGKMIELCLDHCEGIAVRGLTFDYHRPTVSECRCSAADEHSAELEVHPDSPYRIDDGRLIWVGEGWAEPADLEQELIPEADHVWRRRYSFDQLRVQELAPHRLRVTGDHRMTPGRIYQYRKGHRDCCGAFLRHSKDVTLDGIHFAFMHGMGVLGQFTENITLRGVTIAPDPGSGRTCAAWADCTHFSGCRGRITMTGCAFNGAQDDACNIHGTYLRLVDQPGPQQIKVRFMHHQTYGFQAFSPGDEIEFVRADTMAGYASGKIKSAEVVDEYEQLLTLESDAPDWRKNDVVENTTWTPEVEITGCDVKRVPTRGFLISTRRKSVVYGCTFTRVWNGVHVSADVGSWFESGPVRDVTIHDNRFVRCTRPAIEIDPRNDAPNTAFHQNIRVEHNVFELTGNLPALKARSTTGLVFTGNQLVCDPPRRADECVVTEQCERVTVEGNTLAPRGGDHSG